jgi:mono/diheme cytochrome c family protein
MLMDERPVPGGPESTRALELPSTFGRIEIPPAPPDCMTLRPDIKLLQRVALLCLAAIGAIGSSAAAADAPSFSRDVLPILSDNCFGCHGHDEHARKADLRLDTHDGALQAIDLDSPRNSELLLRIESSDPTLRMPPPKTNKRLKPEEIATLRKWIENKAPWGKHWSFEPPVRPQPPRVDGNESPHPIDAFIQARLQREGLTQQPPAPRETLIRRVSFDLTGLPPTRAEVEAFVNDQSPGAYERVVQRLLESPHYGERMAMWWLDAARYADTDGFQGDETRTNWPWRDWVVGAFNRNQPFDQFTIEQFAGDLLPDATPEQKLATCFHRNHMTNGEGGRDPEESRIDYVIDRINTTGTVWLGLTLGCCQCHSHKFDPVSQADYYSLFAFFNSIDEDGKAGRNAKPYLSYQSPLSQRAVVETRELVDQRKTREKQAREEAEPRFADWLAARSNDVRSGFEAWRTWRPAALASIEGTVLEMASDGTIHAAGPNPRQDDYRLIAPVPLPRVTGLRLDVFPHESHSHGGYSRGESGHFILTDIKVQVQRRGSSQIREVAVANAVADFQADPAKNDKYGEIKHVLDDDPRNGWTTNGEEGWKPHRAVFAFAEPLVLDDDEELVFEMRHRSTRGDANIGRFRISITDQAGPAVRTVDSAPLEQLAAALAESGEATIDEKLKNLLREQFLTDDEPYQKHKRAFDRAAAQLAEIEKNSGKVQVMVLAEREKPRETHILVRGVWDKKGDVVERSVPQAIAPWPEGIEKTRLGLAKWIVSRDNPLTARVLVNHLWQMCFGAGLVRTPDDFGVQGERPTHPELLDWLAVELMESGWNIQHVLRLIVTSETYRQSSHVTDELRARDPDNRLLARGARFRLPSWMLRDAALQISGELNPAIGGPPVRPYQPEGVWEEMFMGRFHYEPSEGAAQYRRTLYAFWRRAVGPTFLFDSAQRRVCEVRASRTNTPLHALTLLNDQNFLEASRALADRVMASEGETAARLAQLFQHVLARKPVEREAAVLMREWERAAAHYRQHPDSALRLLNVGQKAPGTSRDPAETAAYMVVASLIFNLDEALNHE